MESSYNDDVQRRRANQVLDLDASQLSWSGSLDGLADPENWFWQELCDRSAYLHWNGCIGESLELVSASSTVESPIRVILEPVFRVTDSIEVERIGLEWSQTLTMVATGCPFGGGRWWFECPGRGCGHRRAKLYRPDRSWWACRVCYGLTYESRSCYSARSWRHPWAGRAQVCDRLDNARERLDRKNMRRGLSRWRKDAKADGRGEMWPIIVNSEAATD